MKRVGVLLSVLMLVMGLSFSAQATLVDMGDGTIYDTDMQLSWLKNANTAGVMLWDQAVAWAASLNNSGGFAGLTGWRLPAADAACGANYNCINSEMGHLYYTELGNPAGGPLTNTGPFTNVQAFVYWSGTEHAPLLTGAWTFYFNDGAQNDCYKNCSIYVWAVRPGARTNPNFAFTATGSMTTTRWMHTATLLNSGEVLLVGGFNDYDSSYLLASAELYDPVSGTFASTGSMSSVRAGHTATLLTNGKVLVAGGSDGSWPYGALASAELYDPDTGTFTPTVGDMTTTRAGHSSALLADGKVLLVGGQANSLPGGGLASAELYDPDTGTFTSTGSMSTNRYLPTAILLANGKVLIAGGAMEGGTRLASAELYDPVSGTFTATGSMSTPRFQQAATLLNNGKVLVVGGGGNIPGPIAGAEFYDSASGTFTLTGSMITPRAQHTATLLNSGEVLVVGGHGASSTIASAEIYSPVSGTFTPTGSMSTPRTMQTATLLDSGEVLVGGGMVSQDRTALSSAELYTITADTTPDHFTFTAQTGVALNTPITSNSITVSGINAPASISITGGAYSINGGGFTSASGSVNNADTVAVKLTSSGSYSTTTSTTLTIGGVSGTFNVTTMVIPPDLVISSLYIPTTVAAPGTNISITDVTKNRLNVPAGPSTTGFYLSSDCTLDGGDILLGSRPVPALAGNEGNTATTSVAIPEGTALGTYYIIAKADSGTAVTEADENNNTRCSSAITLTGSDLVISSVAAPASAKRGTSIALTDQTKNRLPGAASASTTGVYLSTTTTGGSLLGSRPVPALAGYASDTATYSVTIPIGTTPGTWYIIWKADYLGVSGEVDNTNNTKYRAITITK